MSKNLTGFYNARWISLKESCVTCVDDQTCPNRAKMEMEIRAMSRPDRSSVRNQFTKTTREAKRRTLSPHPVVNGETGSPLKMLRSNPLFDRWKK